MGAKIKMIFQDGQTLPKTILEKFLTLVEHGLFTINKKTDELPTMTNCLSFKFHEPDVIEYQVHVFRNEKHEKNKRGVVLYRVAFNPYISNLEKQVVATFVYRSSPSLEVEIEEADIELYVDLADSMNANIRALFEILSNAVFVLDTDILLLCVNQYETT